LSPPSAETGFVTRSLPRDYETIRYVQKMPQNTVRVINYNLGSDFDKWKTALDNQAERLIP